MSSSIPLSALSLGDRATRNRENHRTGVGAPVSKPRARLDPELVRNLMAEQQERVEEKERVKAAATPPPIQWDDAKRTWTPSRRRLATYSDAERRALESRLYHGRNTYHKSDDQLSHELDLDAGDFTDLINFVQNR